MASVLILSLKGDGVPIGLRLADEGHIVKLYLKDFDSKTPALESVKNPSKVVNPKAMLDQYDFILADSFGLGSLCDEMVEKGKVVIGGGSFNDKLVFDAGYSEKVIKTLLPKIPLDVLKGGVEVTTEGWFNGKEFVRPFSHSFWAQRLMVSNVGPLTPCMGVVVYPTNGDKLTNEVLEPLQPLLEKVNYVGPFGVCCALKEQAASFVNFNPGFNYDAVQAWCELLQLTLFNFLYNLVSQKKQEVSFTNERALSVRLSVLPYPYGGFDQWNSEQTLNTSQEAKKHVWVACVNSVLGCITARGTTVRECQRRVYRTIKNLVLNPDVQYRTDIGQGVEEDINKLKEWGWL